MIDFKNKLVINIMQSDLQRIVAKYVNDNYNIPRILPKDVKFTMHGDIIMADIESTTDISISIEEV